MSLRFFLCFLMSSCASYLTYGELESFSSDSFLKVMGVLLNVSSIVFAIIGAWIAIIYPSLLKGVEVTERSAASKQIHESAGDANYLSELFQIVLQSSVVIIFAIVVQVGLPILQAYSYFSIDMKLVKSVAVFIMSFLALLQINAILSVVHKNFGLLKRVRDKYHEDVIDHDL